MARMIKIFDTTLRDGEQSPSCSMNLTEKLEIARQLERLRVDVIEAGFAVASPGDFAAIQAISAAIRDSSVASLSRAVKKDIDAAYAAVKGAVAPRIHTFLATSPIHMEYKLRMTPEQVLERSAQMIAYARSLCPDVEFSAEDATRSEPAFLAKVFEAAIRAGASVLNVADTVGYTTPEEMFALVDYLYKNVEGIEKAAIAVHCHNDLGMAVANSLAAVRAGATQVECTLNGIGERAGNCAMEEIVMALGTRRPLFDVETRIDTRQIYRASRLLSGIIGIPISPTKPIVGANAFAHEAGIHQHGVLAERSTYEIMTPQSIGLRQNVMVLGKHSGRHAFEDRLRDLGVTLSKEDLDESFERFKELADKKKDITDADIEALVSSKSIAIPEAYRLERYIVNSGNQMPAMAAVKLMRDDEILEEGGMGDGPIDAAYKAIDKIVGGSFALEDYAIRSVSGGEDALGEVVVKIKAGDKLVTGRGLSTDIIESSILAYLNGINKFLANNL